ncbi:peroxisomal membrane anchor protein (Pex14), putative [Paecilomyces variotii No. 5]|uniref:Peroxisomal membrane protein PEX14 n=1 Tax=Byssochlamys spectabilis (strain No. 5 / NBRC 109023) TaxID=1356009 RepID=V5FY94_BYSSN|nr:peroxisomal membrane anchor protein (Pex14), putative [Paecilomyces variotii No. 5]
MAREELVSSAVTFLQDPSVASSPLEKRIAFLQSKNLTQEEIDLALARAGGDPSSAVTPASPSQGYAPSQAVYRPPPQGYGYPPYGQWQPPPEVPKRDWRDWFIMATVMGGVGYGMYFVAKRYIAPLIAPPPPPQLQQDKESIDEQFSRAFTLIEQLSTDTAGLKSAEEARTERLDAALREVESVVSELKSSSRRRDDETRRISDEVRSLKDAIPKALEGAREGNENRLKELGTELRSLKVLVGNRLSAGAGSGSAAPLSGRTVGSTLPGVSRPAEEPNGSSTATNSITPAPQDQASGSSPAAASPAPRENTSSPLSQLGRSASIPAWQMAAANRSKSGSQSSPAPAGAGSGSASNDQQSVPPS